MSIIGFELFKIRNKRISFILLFITVLLFPVLMVSVVMASISAGEVSEGMVFETGSSFIIKFSQSLFFIPLWILIFCGNELSNGHVNRVVFFKSKQYYFLSKIVYCGIVSLLFSTLGLISIIVSIHFSGFTGLTVPLFHYVEFFVSATLSSFAYSLLLLCIVFIFKSAVKAYITLIVWQLIEGLGFMIFYKLYNIKLFWLPLHLLQLIYNKKVEASEGSYRRLFYEFEPLVLLPFAFVALITWITYKYFQRTDLKTLSD